MECTVVKIDEVQPSFFHKYVTMYVSLFKNLETECFYLLLYLKVDLSIKKSHQRSSTFHHRQVPMSLGRTPSFASLATLGDVCIGFGTHVDDLVRPSSPLRDQVHLPHHAQAPLPILRAVAPYDLRQDTSTGFGLTTATTMLFVACSTSGEDPRFASLDECDEDGTLLGDDGEELLIRLQHQFADVDLNCSMTSWISNK